MAGNPIVDPAPLTNATRLTWVDLSRTPITDAGPLAAAMHLTRLDLSRTRVRTLDGSEAVGMVGHMTTLHRLANSCLLLESDSGTTLIDPGFFTWGSDQVDLDELGDVQRVLVTHAHPDHVEPDFVRWLVDRGDDVTVHANSDVVGLLADHDIAALDVAPVGTTYEDVLHEPIPTGDTPPNRSWTVQDQLTHPGDSYEPNATAPVLALPMLAPWGSITAAMLFARRLAPRAVVPIHDFYLSASGRQFVMDVAESALEGSGIEVLRLDWGDHATL